MFLVHFYFPTIKNDELEWTKVLLLLGQTKPSQTANLIAIKPLLIKSTILSNYIIHKCLFCLVVKDDMNFYSYLADNSAQWSKAWVLESEGPGSKSASTVSLPVTLDTLPDFFMCEIRILLLYLAGLL